MTYHPIEHIDPHNSKDDSASTTQALKKCNNMRGVINGTKSEPVSSPSGDEDSHTSMSTYHQAAIRVFPENILKPAIRTKLPRSQQRIERTDQLVNCITLLLQDASSPSPPEQSQSLNEAEVAWLVEIKKDPMEKGRLKWIATRMVEAFVLNAIKDSISIAEIVALGPILEKEPFCKLLSSFIKSLTILIYWISICYRDSSS